MTEAYKYHQVRVVHVELPVNGTHGFPAIGTEQKTAHFLNLFTIQCGRGWGTHKKNHKKAFARPRLELSSH
jgi:hypothetical protein